MPSAVLGIISETYQYGLIYTHMLIHICIQTHIYKCTYADRHVYYLKLFKEFQTRGFLDYYTKH